MHLRVIADCLGVATLFPAVQADLNFAVKRGKIALNSLVKACRLAVGIVDYLNGDGSFAK
jgi:hypothetical protein